MDKKLCMSLIDSAEGRKSADLCIQDIKVVDVYNKEVFTSDVYITDGHFSGFGNRKDFPKAKRTISGSGKYLIPGFIDAHCHIESSHLSPSAFSDAVVPTGTTTVIADPHEICNVSGLAGLDYMLSSSENIPLSVYYMFPSCVPCTGFEHAGAILNAKEIEQRIHSPRILGLGEMMNYVGLLSGDETVIDKLECAYRTGKHIDGHAPAVKGPDLDGYAAAGVMTDHECETPEELRERTRRGMYVMLRQGTACKNVLGLLPGVTEKNSGRVLFCTDDRQPQSIKEEGHINYAVNLAISHGLDPLTAISIASLNASACYGLKDRGGIAPGLRADCFIASSLTDIHPELVFINGEEVAKDGSILAKAPHTTPEGVSGMMHVKDFSEQRLALKLKGDHVRVIDIIPGGVVTGAGEAMIKRDGKQDWVHDPDADILKIAVIERHHGTGCMAKALIRGYGMKHGAVATSIAHDSHNIIVIADNDHDAALAVEELIKLGGGITMAKDGKILGSHRLEIAGLMTDEDAASVCETLKTMRKTAYRELGVNPEIDPFMTLCFMALPVIPVYKITDLGLFDVRTFSFVPIELE